MDADATATLHKRGVTATDDSFKFIWNQVGFFTFLTFCMLYMFLLNYTKIAIQCLFLDIQNCFQKCSYYKSVSKSLQGINEFVVDFCFLFLYQYRTMKMW